MKKHHSSLAHTLIRSAFAFISTIALVSQATGTALAMTPVQPQLSPSATLAAATTTEINRRLAEITSDQSLVKSSTVLTPDATLKLTASLGSVQQDLTDQQHKLNGTSDANQINSVATAVDNSFTQYQAANQAAKLTGDLQAQNQLSNKLSSIADNVQGTLDAARAGGATHVNGGVGGFISLKSVQTDLDQLKQNLKSTTAISDSVSSTLTLPINSGLSTPSTMFGSSFGQLAVSQSTLSNTGAGLSQLSNVVTGNKFGISYCGIQSNCNGQTNNGLISVCGVKSDCSNSTNNGGIATCGVQSNCSGSTNNGAFSSCGVKSDCSNSTNNGLFANCGVQSNCSGSTNNGAASVCGIKSNCSNSTNNGGIAACGVKSDCSGSTNNGVLMICGVQSNCSGSTNNGFMFVCGDNSDCSGSTTHSAIFICGSHSNCSTTIVENCDTSKVNSDGQPTQ